MNKNLSILLALLAVSLCGFGQQANPARLDALLVSARQAQAKGDFSAAADAYRQAAKLQPDVPQLWANLGLMEHEGGNYSQAISSFLQANRLDSSLYVPNLFLGIDYAHAEKLASAIPFLIKAERLNKSDPQAPLVLGRAYISAGNLSLAVQELDRATSLSPKLGEAWFALGIAHLGLVENDARTLSEQYKQSPFARALYAASLNKQARFGEAASLYKTLLDADPQPPCLRSELGFALLRDHDPSSAEDQFVAERARHPECSLAILGQIGIAVERGDKHRATELLQELWDRDRGFLETNVSVLLDGSSSDKAAIVDALLSSPESAAFSPELRGALSSAFGISEPSQSSDRTSVGLNGADDRSPVEAYAAGHFFECTQKLEPSMVRLATEKLRLLAACAEFTGNDQLALRAAEALNRLQPHSLEALYWSVQANERLALQALAHFQQLDPGSATSHVLLGDIYHRLERNDDAQAEYLKALAISPGDPAALLGAATAYLSNNNLVAAGKAAQAALAKRPDDPDINLIMAEVELGHRDYASALPHLRRSLRAKPQMLSRVHVLIGKVYAETDRPREAIAELKLGASSDEDGSIHYLLARLYRKLGDTKAAEEALDRTKEIKDQRRERGYKLVEDPDLSSIESPPGDSATP